MLAAIQVDVQDDVWSIITALAAVVAAVGTVAAVVTALFLPIWQERRRRPRLTLRPDALLWSAAYNTPEATGPIHVEDGPVLLLTNETGRETAHNVEVLATLYLRPPRSTADHSPITISAFTDRALNYSDNDGSYGTRSANVGPGATRRVYYLRLGDPTVLFDSWRPAGSPTEPPSVATVGPQFPLICGAWATYPARRDELSWVVADDVYHLELSVTGDNFDALTYRGQVRVELINHVPHARQATVHWLEGPTLATKHIGKPPPWS